MKYSIYIAADLETGETSPIFSARNNTIGRQIFAKMISGKSLDPSTYDLYRLGDFYQNDDEYKDFSLNVAREHVVNGGQLTETDNRMLTHPQEVSDE